MIVHHTQYLLTSSIDRSWWMVDNFKMKDIYRKPKDNNIFTTYLLVLWLKLGLKNEDSLQIDKLNLILVEYSAGIAD
ncbi:hypothetical protein ACJX0J_017517, partial [Zea mays]